MSDAIDRNYPYIIGALCVMWLMIGEWAGPATQRPSRRWIILNAIDRNYPYIIAAIAVILA